MLRPRRRRRWFLRALLGPPAFLLLAALLLSEGRRAPAALFASPRVILTLRPRGDLELIVASAPVEAGFARAIGQDIWSNHSDSSRWLPRTEQAQTWSMAHPLGKAASLFTLTPPTAPAPARLANLTAVYIPLLPLTLLAAIPPAALMLLRYAHRPRDGHCPCCGYSLQGLSAPATCPECGPSVG